MLNQECISQAQALYNFFFIENIVGVPRISWAAIVIITVVIAYAFP